MQKVRLDKSNEPSEVISRYLEAIYYMWSEGEPTRSARLADWLGVSRPTVTVALRRMARDGMVRMNGRKEIEMTSAGRRVAESIVRRHRIMERWLTDVLGLDWVAADTEAAALPDAGPSANLPAWQPDSRTLQGVAEGTAARDPRGGRARGHHPRFGGGRA